MSEAWLVLVAGVVYTLGWYWKGRVDGAEMVRRQNRQVNESRRKS